MYYTKIVYKLEEVNKNSLKVIHLFYKKKE